MTGRVRSAVLACAALGCLLALAPAAAATPPDLTWTGGAVNTSTGWSDAGNWAAVTAPTPSESLGTLTFPQLTSCGGPTSCYLSNNNVSGLSANAVSLDDTAGYGISGLTLALGSGGITAAPGSPVNASQPNVGWSIPLTLTANQSWSITGAAGSGVPYAGSLGLQGPVTGSSTLDVRLADQGYLDETGGMEVSAFSASGANTADTGFEASMNGTVYPTSLNSSSANPVSVTDVALLDEPNLTNQPHNNEIGPLTATGALVDVGDGNVPDGVLAVQGGVTLNSGTNTQLSIDQSGSIPSTDYSQLTATGNVALGGTLSIGSGDCSMGTGSTDTLITTSGTVSGTFANAPEGALVPFVGCPSLAAQIEYTASSVTATVVSGSGTSTTLSASPTTATTNQPISLTATVTAGTPLYAGPAGTVEFLDGSSAIAGCTAQPLTATNASSGTAVCTAPAAAGAPTLTAVFTPSGSTLTGSTSAPLTLTIAKGATATTLAASSTVPAAGQRVTYTANVTPALTGAFAPTGSVAFTENGATIPGCTAQPLDSANVATCTTTYTAAGAHAVTASYQGDGDFNGSSSPTLTVQSSGAPSGATGRATIGHVSVSGASASVQVTCTGATSCSVKLTLTVIETLKGSRVLAVTASKKHKRVIDLGSVTTTIAAGHRETVRITLNHIGKRLLTSHHKLSVKLTLTQTIAGKTSTVAKTLTFKAPKANPKGG